MNIFEQYLDKIKKVLLDLSKNVFNSSIFVDFLSFEISKVGIFLFKQNKSFVFQISTLEAKISFAKSIMINIFFKLTP